jgi:hypothetical protein
MLAASTHQQLNRKKHPDSCKQVMQYPGVVLGRTSMPLKSKRTNSSILCEHISANAGANATVRLHSIVDVQPRYSGLVTMLFSSHRVVRP